MTGLSILAALCQSINGGPQLTLDLSKKLCSWRGLQALSRQLDLESAVSPLPPAVTRFVLIVAATVVVVNK